MYFTVTEYLHLKKKQIEHYCGVQTLTEVKLSASQFQKDGVR